MGFYQKSGRVFMGFYEGSLMGSGFKWGKSTLDVFNTSKLPSIVSMHQNTEKGS
jgi:hypothetical protein